MGTYLKNCYATPLRMFVAGGGEIMSSEGTTQGDPMAMPGYGIGILPLLVLIKADDPALKHVAYADDIGGGSKLVNLRRWWEKVEYFGPLLGYYPKASKSWLVVKEEMLSEAETLFNGTGINITTEGRKYLGNFVGKRTGEEDYVKELVEDWVNQVEELSKIAKCEPQAAYSAFTAGFKHKMTYYMRTIPDLNEIMQPLDNVINKSFIPAITEEHILSPDDRKLLSLPATLGGMGIPFFRKSVHESTTAP